MDKVEFKPKNGVIKLVCHKCSNSHPCELIFPTDHPRESDCFPCLENASRIPWWYQGGEDLQAEAIPAEGIVTFFRGGRQMQVSYYEAKDGIIDYGPVVDLETEQEAAGLSIPEEEGIEEAIYEREALNG